jgi:exo-beta-1,3-glucanase (GH17 family)
MIRINIIIAVAIAAITISFWALVNQPETEPAWPDIIQGFSFSPNRAYHDPLAGNLPDIAEIEEDLALLAGRTHSVRIYSMEGALPEVPMLARKYGLNVALGAWIDKRLEKNEGEVSRLIEVANNNRRNVVRVIVGNEVILRRDLPVEKLIGYIDHVRASVSMPVSTAEPWHVWLKHPELVSHVDYIAVHMLPYW